MSILSWLLNKFLPGIPREELCRFIGSYAVGLLAMWASASPFAFEAIKVELYRDGLNLTHFQANTVLWSGLFGWSLALPSGYLSHRLGPIWCCVISCLSSTVSYLLLWSTVKACKFYVDKVWLIAIYGFMAGHSVSYLYQTTLVVNLRNATKRNVGKIMGNLHIPFAACPLLLSRLVSLSQLDYPGVIFLMQLCMVTGASFLCILALRARPKPEYELNRETTAADLRALTTRAYEYPASDTESVGSLEDDDLPIIGPSNSPNTSLPPIYTAPPPPPFPWKRLLSFRFHLSTWSFAFSAASCLRLFISLDSLTDMTIFTVTTCVTRASFGHLSDALKESVSRANFIFVGLLLQLIGGAFAAIYWHNNSVFVIFIALSAVSYGLEWCLLPSIVREKFGLRHFAIFWSVILTVFVCIALLLHVIMEHVFTLFCHGAQCRLFDLLLYNVATLCALIWTCGLID